MGYQGAYEYDDYDGDQGTGLDVPLPFSVYLEDAVPGETRCFKAEWNFRCSLLCCFLVCDTC